MTNNDTRFLLEIFGLITFTLTWPITWPMFLPYYTFRWIENKIYNRSHHNNPILERYSNYDKTCLIIDNYTTSTEILIKIITEDINRTNYHIDLASNKFQALRYLEEYNIKYDYIFFNDKIIDLSSDNFNSKLIQIKDFDSIIDSKAHYILHTPIMNKFKVDAIFN